MRRRWPERIAGRRKWLQLGDISLLLQRTSKPDPRSLMRGCEFHANLLQVFQEGGFGPTDAHGEAAGRRCTAARPATTCTGSPSQGQPAAVGPSPSSKPCPSRCNGARPPLSPTWTAFPATAGETTGFRGRRRRGIPLRRHRHRGREHLARHRLPSRQPVCLGWCRRRRVIRPLILPALAPALRFNSAEAGPDAPRSGFGSGTLGSVWPRRRRDRELPADCAGGACRDFAVPRHGRAEVSGRVVPDGVVRALAQYGAAVSSEVALQLAALQAAATSIVSCSTWPPPIGGSRPSSW